MRSIQPKSTSRSLTAVLCLVAALVLAGCATGYGANRGDYGQQYPRSDFVDVVGTVIGVERGYDRIVLEVRGDSYSTPNDYHGRGEQVEVRYNQNTTLYYQGRAVSVEGLERGDVIRAEGRRSGNGLVADSIKVLRNVRDYRDGGYGDDYGDGYGDDYGDGYGDDYGDGYGDDYGDGELFRGTVRYVEPRDRVISLDVAGGERVWVRYDNRTIVEYDGRRYQPTNLERGDFVRIEAQRHGNDWVAEVIHVQRDATRY